MIGYFFLRCLFAAATGIAVGLTTAGRVGAQPVPAPVEVSPAESPVVEDPMVEDPDAGVAIRGVEWSPEIEKVLAKRSPESIAELKLIQTQLQRVVEYGTPATVAVRVGGAFGSAVIVSPEGRVLTAGHVVGHPNQPVTFIFPDGTTAKGKTLGMHREIDSGMMQITDPGPWPFVKIADAGKIRTGEWVVTIGHPGGFDDQRTPPVRLGRVLSISDKVINTDCKLVGGDSGGPLFNMRGELVGIHSRIGRRITNNFHVPISTYHDSWDRLAASEKWGAPLDSGGSEPAESRPFLGVACDPRSDQCRLTQVYAGSAAARAGLQVGDVVHKFDGQKIETFEELSRLILTGRPGRKVPLEILRGEQTLHLEVVIGQIGSPLPGSPQIPEK